jgi:hypothetical protein
VARTLAAGLTVFEAAAAAPAGEAETTWHTEAHPMRVLCGGTGGEVHQQGNWLTWGPGRASAGMSSLRLADRAIDVGLLQTIQQSGEQVSAAGPSKS